MEILGIGYVGFESPNPDKWRGYASEVLGMELGKTPDGGDQEAVYLRMDDRNYRLVIHPGALDRVAYIGWEVPGRDEYRAALARFAEAGVEVTVGDKALCERRGVREVACFRDPVGYAHEIFYSPRYAPGSFRAGRDFGGFDTGDKGVGHIVLISPEPVTEIDKLFQDVMGFRFVTHGKGMDGNTTFLNPQRGRRSHCIAYAHIPGKMGIQHFGMPMISLDAVGIAYDIVQKREGMLQSTLGRHTQDPVVSFYHFAPSGFIIECFWEDRPWDEYGPVIELNPPEMSLWGHELRASPFPNTIRDATELR